MSLWYPQSLTQEYILARARTHTEPLTHPTAPLHTVHRISVVPFTALYKHRESNTSRTHTGEGE